LAREYILDLQVAKSCEQIEKVQCYLQDLNSNIATPRNSSSEFKVKKTFFDPELLGSKDLEKWIDEMDSDLPALKNFILPVTCFKWC
jgi:cob(I)alamin adenosyltransferase